MQEPDPMTLERELLLFQERLRDSFESGTTKREEKTAHSIDLNEHQKQLKLERQSCRRVRAELFEACCELQRNCSAARLERLAILTASLKFIEGRYSQHYALVKRRLDD